MNYITNHHGTRDSEVAELSYKCIMTYHDDIMALFFVVNGTVEVPKDITVDGHNTSLYLATILPRKVLQYFPALNSNTSPGYIETVFIINNI